MYIRKVRSVSEMIEHGFCKTHEDLITVFVIKQLTYTALFSLKQHNSTEHRNLKFNSTTLVFSLGFSATDFQLILME